ncbi:probable hexosyltransferase MUCI70 isoform X1 [Cannabis sativa]|uniref:probable hexosyltransferase MUCI70 isoform X1 n=1 Tax=Cannabis sativa TaxID=3483 RepID=UPI0029CA2BDC|nr:probable hexosyltransferase MUCI70 isoform X1 [Cannabis sativa]
MNCYRYLEKRGLSNDNAIRFVRRGKRFGRIPFPRHKLSTWTFLFGTTFLICFLVFSNLNKIPFHEKFEESPLILQQAHPDLRESETGRPPPPPPPPPPRSKRGRQHFPCEIGFAKSVDYLVEPSDLTNFTQFSLKYIDREQKTSSNNVFDLRFGGHQTLEERQQSFYAKNQTLHCGFVKGRPGYPSTGFEINEKDKAYMNTCKIVVSSCIFGNSDFLRRPTSKQISGYSKDNVCFVMFVDEQTLSKLSMEGNVPDDGGKIGLWRLVVVRNLPYKDMRRTGKVPKLLSHRLFPSARYSIWLDSKMRLHIDPMLILERFLWRTKSEYAISNHYDRHCVWEEVLQNKRLNKYNHTAIDEQFNFYQSDGLTKFDPSDPNKLLPSYVPEGSFIVRAHTPMSNLFSCLWFNEVDRFTSRDQLSFAYTYLKLKRMNPDKPFNFNMFKDCERRTLAKLFRHRITVLPS